MQQWMTEAIIAGIIYPFTTRYFIVSDSEGFLDKIVLAASVPEARLV